MRWSVLERPVIHRVQRYTNLNLYRQYLLLNCVTALLLSWCCSTFESRAYASVTSVLSTSITAIAVIPKQCCAWIFTHVASAYSNACVLSVIFIWLFSFRAFAMRSSDLQVYRKCCTRRRVSGMLKLDSILFTPYTTYITEASRSVISNCDLL